MNTVERPNFAWKVARVWLWFMTHFVWKVTVEGLENLPQEGGFILCPNHATAMDPPLIAYYLYPRPVHYWAKIELFQNKYAAWVLRQLYTIPIDRGKTDRAAIRAATELLVRNLIVGSFPEGSRHSDEVKKGSAFISIRSRKPMVPTWIDWDGHKVGIRFGTPILPIGSVDELTTVLGAAIEALK
jgi:1-acyl-sn-glycerol-3-phosphate acyltransferase